MLLTRSRSASLIVGAPSWLGAGEAGVHNFNRSLAKQCGRRREGVGVRCCGYWAGALAVGVFGVGMGRWRILASGALRCLIAWGSPSSVSIPESCDCARRLTTALFAISPASNIDEERTGFDRDNDWAEEERSGGVNAPRRGVGGVLGAGDVSRIYCSAMLLRKSNDAPEHEVGWPIGAAFLPPTFDDPPVVSIDDDVVPLT